jgi:competence protein ComEC
MVGSKSQWKFLDTPSIPPWVRPLCALAIAFATGIASDRYPPWSVSQAWLAALTGVLLGVHLGGLLRFHWLRFAPFSLVLFFCLGTLAARTAAPQPHTLASLDPFLGPSPTLFLAEVVASPEPYPDKTRLALRLHRACRANACTPLDVGVLLSVRDCQREWLPGDFLLTRLVLKRIHGFNNPGGFDYERMQAERGFFATALLTDDRFLVKLDKGHRSALIPPAASVAWTGWSDRFRMSARNWINAQLPRETAAIYAALLLGYQNQVSKAQQEDWTRAGVTHLLSISGQHLGLVAMAAFWLLRRVFRWWPKLLERTSDQHLALGGALLLALLYAAIGGLALATWRSAIMLTLFFAGIYCYRAPDLPSALASAALIILLMQPFSLWNPSFQLSFGALFGIFILYPRFQPVRKSLTTLYGNLAALLPSLLRKASALLERLSVGRYLAPFADAFWVSLAANIMVLPLVAHHFHGISLAGFAANTVLVPLVGFLSLPLGLLSLAVFAVSARAAAPLLVAGGWTIDLCEQVVAFFSQPSWAYCWVGVIGVCWLFIIYGCMGILLSAWKRRTKMISLALLALCSLPAAFSSAPLAGNSTGSLEAQWTAGMAGERLQALVIDVGQGSSTLIRFPNGQTMLIDGGGFHDDAFDIGRNVLAPVLWRLGVNRLDFVVLSHDHPDHRNGLRFILAHFPVGAFWETGIQEGAAADSSASLPSIARQRSIPVRHIKDLPEQYALGKCRLSLLHPSRSYRQTQWDGNDLNNVSLVIQVDHQDTHLIVPGDIDQSVERFLFTGIEFPGKVLLVAPHHGSHRSNSDLLLNSLKPQAVVISCGYENWFGFPDKQLLARLNANGIASFRTDMQGAVWATSDGTGWDIRTFKDMH